MAMTRLLDRLARMAPVPVFVARGVDAGRGLAHLLASPEVEVVDTPRHATILVIAGAVPRSTVPALVAVHDQIPGPRGVAAVDVTGDLDALGLGSVAMLPTDDPVPALRARQTDVLDGVDSPPRGRADHPVDWQGVGPHGQGGEGMMGGTPYGRPMPMPPTEGRDGLALDRLSLRLGPFLSGLPPGIALDVGLQGDVLAEVEISPVPADDDLVGVPADDAAPATVRDARHRLAAIADLCALAGLDALARRAARVAVDPTPGAVDDLRRRLDRRWGLRAATDGVGILREGGEDVTARWRAWFDQAQAALAGAAPEVPHIVPDTTAVADGLVGMELGQAWLTLCSLQLDLLASRPTTLEGTA